MRVRAPSYYLVSFPTGTAKEKDIHCVYSYIFFCVRVCVCECLGMRLHVIPKLALRSPCVLLAVLGHKKNRDRVLMRITAQFLKALHFGPV